MSYKFLDLQGLSRFLDKVKALIPVKTSELQNDSGFTTADSALSNTSENAVQNKVVKNALDLKANDSGVVHTTGNESISGTKSFNSDLNLNYASTDVDDIVDSIPGLGTVEDYVHISGAETISGVKTFSDGIVANVSGTATPLSHTHGNLSNDGKIGTTANKPVITGTNGVLTAGEFGTSANTFCEGNDLRLSDARTPVSHSHGSISNDGKLANGNKVVITNANKVITESSVTDTELGYLSGVSSAVQTQINDKADDSSVVHLTGDESISGTKTFTSGAEISNTDTTASTPQIILKNYKNSRGSTTLTGSQSISFNDKDNKGLGTLAFKVSAIGNTVFDLTTLQAGSNSNTVYGGLSYIARPDSNDSLVPSKNTVDLGSSTYKWNKIYSDDVVHTTGNESISGTKSFNSDLNLNYANTDVDDIVDSTPGTGTSDIFVHNTGAETISGVKTFSDGIVANVSGNCTKDGSGNVITSTYGALSANNTWSGNNTFSSETSVLNVKRTNDNNYCDLRFLNSNDNTLTALRDNNLEFTIGKRYNGSNVWYTGAQITLSNAGDVKVIAYDGTETWTTNFTPTGIYPTSNNALDLGSSANRWKSVYANSYYYGTTKWGLDQANVWTNTNTFNQNIVYQRTNFFHRGVSPCYYLEDTVLEKGVQPAEDHCAYTGCWRDKNGLDLGSARFVQYANSEQSFEINVNNLSANGAMSPTGSNCSARLRLRLYPKMNSSEFVVYTNVLTPGYPGSSTLGSSSFKWKTLNGVNPGALSLPNLSVNSATGSNPPNGYVDIDTTNWDLTGENSISYTPPVDGWISIRGKDEVGNFIFATQICIRQSVLATGALSTLASGLSLVMPVNKNVAVTIYCKVPRTSLIAYFTPCQGNV